MSDCTASSRDRSRRGASSGDKPSHVKRLNFGRSILELDVVEQCNCSAANRAVTIDQNVAGIPCTVKKDYVRKWIEALEDGGRDDPSRDDLSRSSPVLGTSATRARERSPILGSGEKRSEVRTCINRRTAIATEGANDADRQEQNARRSASCAARRRLDSRSKKENEEEQGHLSKAQCTPPCIERVVGADESPILGTRLYSYKRRRKKLHHESQDCVSSKRISVNDGNLEENLDGKIEGTVFPIETIGSPEGLQMSTHLLQTQERLSSEDSLSDDNNKDNPEIEVETSDDSENGERDKVSSAYNSRNNSPTDIIEEVDTQDMVSTALTSQLSAKILPVARSSKLSQLTANNLNETYCSGAEMMLDQSTHLSAKISQVPSMSKEVTESRSTQTPVISTITTPSKVSPDKIIYTRLLDSGKKRRKPKKGSMVAKLQSLINVEISGIRIWRHRMYKKQDDELVQFISVLVRDCTKQFGNQFLNGILIEDRFNLLQNDVEIEEAKSRDVQAPPKGTTHRDITIILVCDIVGTLRMISEIVINVYPPWTVLDKVDLTLEAAYIGISHNRDIPDIANKDSRKREKRIIKEFNCPCIEEERELPFCARKPNVDKPDVMQRIFDF